MKNIIFLILIMFNVNLYAPTIRVEIGHSNIYSYLFDIKIRNILETIRRVESNNNYYATGLSGEYGAYQIMSSTWKIWCYEFFGYLLESTPKNQDTITYLKIKQWLNKGKTIEEIALLWNAGTTTPQRMEGVNKYGVYFNVKKYIEKFIKTYKTISYERDVK